MPSSGYWLDDINKQLFPNEDVDVVISKPPPYSKDRIIGLLALTTSTGHLCS